MSLLAGACLTSKRFVERLRARPLMNIDLELAAKVHGLLAIDVVLSGVSR